MATIGSIIGSKYIGTPITVPVTAATISGNPTFHRVRLVVIINSTQQFPMSRPVAEGETIEFDISSAFIAVADAYQYQADRLNPATGDTYPQFTCRLQAYDDYLLDGEEHTIGPSEAVDGQGYCIGALTDRERLTGARPQVYSRKPTSSPEIVHIGKQHIVAGSTASVQHVTAINITASTPATAAYYPIPAPADSYELRFINSLGVHESAHISCLRTTDVNISTTKMAISVQERIDKFSRGMMLKENDYETWHMTTGPIDRQWMQYWLHEVLMAHWAWLKVDGAWLPVHIVTDETVAGPDRTKAGMMQVEFGLQFDINGSPLG